MEDKILEINNLDTKEKDNYYYNDFLNSLKYNEDPDKKILLKLQDELETKGINQENILQLTKNLSKEQKNKLEELYKQQIYDLKLKINEYKNKIISIRKDIKK